jgi:hypothetical protein
VIEPQNFSVWEENYNAWNCERTNSWDGGNNDKWRQMGDRARNISRY